MGEPVFQTLAAPTCHLESVRERLSTGDRSRMSSTKQTGTLVRAFSPRTTSRDGSSRKSCSGFTYRQMLQIA